MTNKAIIFGLFGALLAGAVGGLVVHVFAPAPNQIVQQVAGTSPTNTTFGTQKILGIKMSLSSGTTSSVINNTANDMFITRFDYACTGVGTSLTAYTGAGLANLTVKAATSSTSLSGSTPTSNVAANSNLAIPSSTISTSTASVSAASSTVGTSAPVFLDVPAGAYLTFITNATNTAACTFQVQTVSI